jgi:hypothetical protein
MTTSPQDQSSHMMVGQVLDVCTVNRQCVGVLFIDGRYIDTLDSGLYAFRKGTGDAKVLEIDLRETMADVSGQEIITSDKVSLRMNAVVTYRIVDARKAGRQPDSDAAPGSFQFASMLPGLSFPNPAFEPVHVHRSVKESWRGSRRRAN